MKINFYVGGDAIKLKNIIARNMSQVSKQILHVCYQFLRLKKSFIKIYFTLDYESQIYLFLDAQSMITA